MERTNNIPLPFLPHLKEGESWQLHLMPKALKSIGKIVICPKCNHRISVRYAAIPTVKP